MDVEGIREAHEEVEECAVIDGFGDLGIRPSRLTEPLDLLVGDAVRVSGQRLDEVQQESVLRGQAGGVEVPVAQRGRRLRVLLPLQLQEPGMAAESVMTAVERRDVGGDHFVLSSAERAVGEMQSTRRIDGAQKVRSQGPCAEYVGTGSTH